MGEILLDGSIQGYSTYCSVCGATVSCNIQGDIYNHDCPLDGEKLLIINCPDCYQPIMLTKKGKIPYHGRRYFYSNIRYKPAVIETKSFCSAGGRKPDDILNPTRKL